MPKIKPARHRPPEANSGEADGDVNHFIKKVPISGCLKANLAGCSI
jgi:hypothetical protein